MTTREERGETPQNQGNTPASEEGSSFGEKVRQLLKEKGVSQNWLAKRMDVTKGTASNILNGKTTVTLSYVKSIAQILEVDVFDLVAGTEHADLVDVKDDTITECDEQNEALAERIAEQEAELASNRAEIKRLTTQREQLKSEHLEALQRRDKELEKLKAALEDAKKAAEVAKAGEANAERRLDEHKAKAESQLQALRDHIRRLDQQLQDALVETDRAWASCTTQRNQIQRLKAQIKELEKKLKAAGNTAVGGALLAGLAGAVVGSEMSKKSR
ncbi:MAG: hypothetical protein CMH57_02615 [Myxococcales bacterium]|nr:hypothetical protein [Myxococcales bacterium]